ncbi:MAG: ABC transporter permease [Nitrospira sp.]|nr:MAG: ABC transporter permease [Nitrospira sp.]
MRCVLKLRPFEAPRLITSGFFLFLLVIWYSVTRGNFVDSVFLPPPEQTLKSLFSLLSSDFAAQHLIPSMTRVIMGFALSIAIAFPLGILASQVPFIASIVHPLCGVMRYVPVAALVPLCILWFGIHEEQKIAVIVIGVVFQLVLLIASNATSTPSELIETGSALGLSRSQILFRIVIPWSMPANWDDLRISAGWAWSYVVLAELVAGNRGIGYFVVQSQRFLATADTFAAIILIGILGLVTDFAFRLSARRMFRWR